MLEQIAGGSTFTEALQRCGHWLPAFDLALLQAGEHSGRLDACFRLLADYYTDRARLARQMIGDLAYPAFLLHFAVFIFPFAQFFTSGNWVAYLRQTLGVLIPLYAVVALMIFAAQSRHGETWRACFETLLHPIPVLGQARRYLALARLAAALEALLSAGVTIIEAWELAATASGSPALRRTVLGVAAAGERRPDARRGGQRFRALPGTLCQPVCDRRNQRTARRHLAAPARLLPGGRLAQAPCRGAAGRRAPSISAWC